MNPKIESKLKPELEFNQLPFSLASGLCPRVRLCVGAGFAREDIKSLLLSQGLGFTADAVTTPQEICIQITGIPSEQVLSSPSRQEVLRVLLSEPRIISEMPEIRRVKRQRNFLRRLDLALQSGRMAFAHAEEERVYSERLSQVVGEKHLRRELSAFARAYETWLEVSSYVDFPLLLRKANQVLQEGWPKHLALPQEIWYLSVQTPESLEREFWDLLSRYIQVKQIHNLREAHHRSIDLIWQRWHTLDDAAEAFVDLLIEKQRLDWNEDAVLIPDIPSVRRCLRRALEGRNIPLADSRDPTRLRWDESVKWALLPLEVVGKNFERQKVIAWLRNYQLQEEFPAWIKEINSRGIRNGIYSYSGGMLAGIYSRLQELEQQLGGRKTCAEIKDTHLRLLRSHIGTRGDLSWLIDFFEQMWKSLASDITRVGQENKKAPLYFWLDRLQSRVYEASPPIEKLKPSTGLRLYRLQQAPILPAERVWVFGLPPHWMSGEGAGDYWFSEREREILGLEFSVRSAVQVREERLVVLKSWILSAQSVLFLDAEYDVDGRERESILSIIKELEMETGIAFPSEPIVMGAHPRFLKSYNVIRPLPQQRIKLQPLKFFQGVQEPELTATVIEHYGRCPFQALVYDRWNLRDIREPDAELWPDVRGNILHEAVRLIRGSMDSDGNSRIRPSDALEQAWSKKKPQGLIKSRRLERYIKSKLCQALEIFCEKEKEYIQRSKTRPLSLEQVNLKLSYSGFSIRGLPDRIDQHSDGLFIIDYKSSGSAPSGSDMVESGYRLQLPFYAIAARKKISQPVLGVQFVELNRKGNRNSGIFFKEFNGKSEGSLTQVRSNSKSLISMEPDLVWDQLEKNVIQDAKQYLEGIFEAKPRLARREKECSSCSLNDLCGFRRLVGGDEYCE